MPIVIDLMDRTDDTFSNLWRYLRSLKNVSFALKSVAEKVCIVPTTHGIACSLSPGNSIVDVKGLDLKLI